MALVFPPIRKIRQQLHYCDREIKRLNLELSAAKEQLSRCTIELQQTRASISATDEQAKTSTSPSAPHEITRMELEAMRAALAELESQYLVACKLNNEFLRERGRQGASTA